MFTFNGIAFKSLLIKQFTSLLLPHCLYNGVLRRCRRNGALFVENSNTINIGNALSVNQIISLPPPPQKIAYLGSRNSKNACTHLAWFFWLFTLFYSLGLLQSFKKIMFYRNASNMLNVCLIVYCLIRVMFILSFLINGEHSKTKCFLC